MCIEHPGGWKNDHCLESGGGQVCDRFSQKVTYGHTWMAQVMISWIVGSSPAPGSAPGSAGSLLEGTLPLSLPQLVLALYNK